MRTTDQVSETRLLNTGDVWNRTDRGEVVSAHTMKAYGGMWVAHSLPYRLVTSVLDRCEWSASRSSRSPPGNEKVCTHSIRDCFGPQSWSRRFGKGIRGFPMSGIEPRFISCSPRIFVAITTRAHF